MHQRRHDIDALRVIAFGLLILYHVGMVYVTEWDYHIKSSYLVEGLQWPMIALNRWRMPLLFMISGIAIGLFQPSRATMRFSLVRSWRLLLPLIFGMVIVVPIQAYCQAVTNGGIEPGLIAFFERYWKFRPWPEAGFSGASYGVTWNHLWYLAYLWTYTMILVALLPILESGPGLTAQRWLAHVHGGWLIVVPAAFFIICLVRLQPVFPGTHALIGDWYLHTLYFSVFFCGYVIARHDGFWVELRRLRWKTLSLALAAVAVELALRAAGRLLVPGDIPEALLAIDWGLIERVARGLYMWCALLAILAWASVLLDRPFRWLPYANEAVYPWYILHQSLIVPLAFVLIPLRLGPWVEPALVTTGTIAGCLLIHEIIIRRSALLRPLFGLKRATRAPSTRLASPPRRSADIIEGTPHV